MARPIEKRYALNDRLANLFERAMHTLDRDLNFALYQAIAYLLPEKANQLYDNAELVSRSLSSIRKNGLVKRLESSFEAFKASIDNFRRANQHMLDMLANDKVFIAPDLNINAMFDAEMVEEAIEARVLLKAETNQKNAIFAAADFNPKYVELLQADQRVLDQMCADWSQVTDADDSKFAKLQDLLKHELFKSSRNPGQKLVVFSESIDTVNYLARRLERDDVLVVTSANRNELFATIRENFDANYPKQLDRYNIILTTDVLAEGINLHRSNIIVNYDTPWNSTRLMQRIGRVNRIGSTSEHIYNYVFYPSREGNREINLTQIALSKIQTFHTIFGEDNQIYSQDEIIDRNLGKLFDETVKAQQEDLNKEIPYFEELRTLYQTNRAEYNRIAKLSLRSRTGRESRTVDGVKLSDDTLVFLKTNFRKVVFLVSEEAREISALDALQYFKAEPTEQKVERTPQHHEQVELALQKFIQNTTLEIQKAETLGKDINSQGVQVVTARNLVKQFVTPSDEALNQKLLQLVSLVDRGVINLVVRRLQKLHKLLKEGRANREDVGREIIEMAHRYAPYYVAEDAYRNDQETEAAIILSESFN